MIKTHFIKIYICFICVIFKEIKSHFNIFIDSRLKRKKDSGNTSLQEEVLLILDSY